MTTHLHMPHRHQPGDRASLKPLTARDVGVLHRLLLAVRFSGTRCNYLGPTLDSDHELEIRHLELARIDNENHTGADLREHIIVLVGPIVEHRVRVGDLVAAVHEGRASIDYPSGQEP